MVVLYQSQTYPINPPNASPVLTLAEFWEVMQVKCRKPELFVAPISACEVLEETDKFMKRTVTFREGMGPPGGKVVEDMDIRAPWKVDFRNLDTGAFINNTISQGKDETDLYLTFYFEWPYPKIEEGSEEAKKTSDQLWEQARKTVQHTIDVAREMKGKGELKH
ncbi:hypothetical protein HO133_006594 [Letharia lupina]|uniref:DUF1857-domain-containing protein n=2 Tax=Letharia TaxID=112415 RepID=A0A8H6C6E1_9LECA|nr:uncharacterized protein HO133_006594 [Letharia lupina]XP_037163715.1 uncharacterized protein HO173_007351 [Letharia columbiana]KAF6217767.1 hypothetical protein HO133_006594 [Letharia lupina]KAF6234318.1 hypothetical protein HO173_007351 [Letharia columbiana]